MMYESTGSSICKWSTSRTEQLRKERYVFLYLTYNQYTVDSALLENSLTPVRNLTSRRRKVQLN